jgi:DNA-binding response OmpR family regulator/pSer/pThr/pTyr-binding forkhead associated (FHA) protein
MIRDCPKCGLVNPPEALSCDYCGVAVAESGQLADYDAIGQKTVEALAKARKERKSLRLLLVETDDDLPFLMRKSMERVGHQVTWCATAAEGVVAVRQGNFDLIIVEQALPDMSGVDLLQTLRREGVTTPVIMVSGLDDPALISQAFRAGASDFVIMDRALTFLAELPYRVNQAVQRSRSKSDQQCALEGGPKPRSEQDFEYEAWKGRETAKSDLYSLAINYAEKRLGREVFEGGTFTHLQSEPNLDPLPPEEKAVLLRALAKDPADRFATCSEFIKALGVAVARPELPVARPELPVAGYRIRLRGVNGDVDGKIWENEAVVRAGRLATLEIVLDDSSVSRCHAEIRPTANGWRVKDLGSTNGTFINGTRLGDGEYAFKAHDILRLGNVTFVVDFSRPENRSATERGARMDDRKLELLEGHEYSLNADEGDGARFVGLFRRCWNAIPEVDRQTILDYWRCREEPFSAAFVLSNLWRDSAESHAQVSLDGYLMRFNAESFSIIPERPGLFIVAHELAHVYGWASGKTAALKRSICEANVDTSVASELFQIENEANADALAVQWGFDRVARDRLILFTKAFGLESACKMMANAAEDERIATPGPPSRQAFPEL